MSISEEEIEAVSNWWDSCESIEINPALRQYKKEEQDQIKNGDGFILLHTMHPNLEQIVVSDLVSVMSHDDLLINAKKFRTHLQWVVMELMIYGLLGFNPICIGPNVEFLNLSYMCVDDLLDQREIPQEDKKKFLLYCRSRISTDFSLSLIQDKNKDKCKGSLKKSIESFDSIVSWIQSVNTSFFNNKSMEGTQIFGCISQMFDIEFQQLENTPELSPRELLKQTICKGAFTFNLLVKMILLDMQQTSEKLSNHKVLSQDLICKIGFITQMLDDLCDIKEDQYNQNVTYPILLLKHQWSFDMFIIKLFNSIESIWTQFMYEHGFDQPSIPCEMGLCLKTTLLNVLFLGVHDRQIYETYSPFSFKYLSHLKIKSYIHCYLLYLYFRWYLRIRIWVIEKLMCMRLI